MIWNNTWRIRRLNRRIRLVSPWAPIHKHSRWLTIWICNNSKPFRSLSEEHSCEGCHSVHVWISWKQTWCLRFQLIWVTRIRVTLHTKRIIRTRCWKLLCVLFKSRSKEKLTLINFSWIWRVYLEFFIRAKTNIYHGFLWRIQFKRLRYAFSLIRCYRLISVMETHYWRGRTC